MDRLAFQQRYGPWALVTGASSGIGAEFARQLAALGIHTILVARREKQLSLLATELSDQHQTQSIVLALDLGQPGFLSIIRRHTDGLDVGLLVSCAGFAHTGNFLADDLDHQLQMLHLNCRAPMMLAHAFGQRMVARKGGGIILLSSIVGFSAVPGWTQYSASKGYNLLFAEGLAAELAGDQVDVLALCPGSVHTEFLERSQIDPFLAMQPKEVVRLGLHSLGRRRTVVPGMVNKLLVNALRLVPRRFGAAVAGAILDWWAAGFQRSHPTSFQGGLLE